MAEVIEVERRLGFILKEKQREVIAAFVKGNDVFAVLPSGFCKTLCYTCLPMVFDGIRNDGMKTIIIIVTPLSAFIKDHLRCFVIAENDNIKL